MFRKVIMFSLLLVFVVSSFVNSSSAELTIEPSGNVGIGTTTPGAKLHVNSTANTNNTIGIFESDIDSGGEYNEFRFSAAGNTSPAAIRYMLGTNPNSSELSFLQQPDSGSGLVERMRIDKNGSVGIGTSSPDATFKFHVNEGGAAAGHVARFSSSAESTYVSLSNTAPGGGSWYLRSKNTGNLAIHQPGVADRLIVTSSGNVGIGTTNPQGKLDVNGTIYQRGSQLHADYVFESDYDLESIREHAKFMWKNKHLKAVPKQNSDENGLEIIEVGSHRRGMLEELEKAHIYIEQLAKQNKALEARLAKVETLLNNNIRKN